MPGRTEGDSLMDATTRTALEALYNVLLSAVVLLARALDKEYPLARRCDRRQQARELLQALDQR